MQANDSRGKESSATTETYYLATGRYGHERTLHADPECPAFDPDSTVRERTFVDFDPDLLCGRCVDQEDGWNQGGGDYSYQQALREAADENLVTDGGEEVVWISSHTGGHLSIYHTDPDCRALDRANDVFRKSPAVLPADMSECGICAGDEGPADPHTGEKLSTALHRASADELDGVEKRDLIPDGGEEIVWVRARKSGDRNVFHTDRDCSALNRAESITTKPRRVLWNGVTECSYCAGEFTGADDHQGHATVDALDDAAPDALPDGGAEVVWTASTGGGESIDTYHTDRDCPSLGSANSVIERERDLLPDRATHCLVCQDRLDDREYDPDWSYQAALRDHNSEDLVTDGGARLRSKAEANTGELSRAGVVNWPKPEKEYVDLVQLLKADIQTDGGRLRHDHVVAAVLEGRRRPSERLRENLRADGSGLPEPDRSEQERRARQAATSLLAWSRRAGVDPAVVLNEVRDGLPRADDGDPDHYCEICERPFETIARLIKHDCGEQDAPLVTDGGVDIDELSEEEISAVVNTRMFQKALAYRRLADGISVLEDEDQVFESLVTSITKQHSQVRSEDSTREFFRLFREEVETFTEELTNEDENGGDASDLRDLVDERGDQG
jgi:hypothetical protein